MAEHAFQLVAGNLCLDFINTLDERGYPELEKELLASPADLLAFLRQSHALPHHGERNIERRNGGAERLLERARNIRETLYRIFAGIVEKRGPAAEDLDEISAHWRRVSKHFHLRRAAKGFEWQWSDAENESAADLLLWPILRSAIDLLTSPELERVRMCESETCRWLFFDTSRNHSRRWCDMKVCGNRTKVRRFYQRHHAAERHS